MSHDNTGESTIEKHFTAAVELWVYTVHTEYWKKRPMRLSYSKSIENLNFMRPNRIAKLISCFVFSLLHCELLDLLCVNAALS